MANNLALAAMHSIYTTIAAPLYFLGCREGVGLAGRKWSSVPDTCKTAGHIPAPGMNRKSGLCVSV